MSGKIVLSGLAGSGKSTVGKLLAKQLGWRFISMGEFSREYAERKYNLDINAFQDLCLSNPLIDDELDNQFIKFCSEETNLVIDYRLGFHFINDAVSVFLSVSEKEAGRRIANSGRQHETASTIVARNSKMIDRFIVKYGVNFSDTNNYSFTICTDDKTPKEICEIITQMQFFGF